ncbi:AI-2E family transporter [Pacificimonas sp. WHA3]|uniref:AI-2E family transporter n=1 Tax=Pacificimonas pallii TaxID=2827236 RepID=A0ABS6SF52_9SPHN|nr:AI-2E family transporter [Pacificimonas pallii]MBV7257038.1 AI-2E family transporter [Pacificimonas pallii]
MQTDFLGRSIRLPALHWGWLALAAIIVWFVWQTAAILPPFIAGLVIAYLLDPVADRMEEKGIRRWVATAIVLTLFFAVFIGIILLIAPLVVSQFEALIETLPGLVDTVRPLAEKLYAQANLLVDLESVTDDMLQRGAEFATTIMRGVLAQGLAVANLLALLVIMPVVAFYSLRDFDDLTAQVQRYFPVRHADRIKSLLTDMDHALAGFVRGQFLVCFVLALCYAAGWWLTGLDYALVLGLIAGILAFIPYLGAVISVALALLVGLGQFGLDWWQLFLIFLVFQLGQVLEGSILTPNLVGERIGLHPLWVLFAVFAGGELAGLWGVFLAVPIAAILAVLVRAVMRAYLESPIYSAEAGPAADSE